MSTLKNDLDAATTQREVVEAIATFYGGLGLTTLTVRDAIEDLEGDDLTLPKPKPASEPLVRFRITSRVHVDAASYGGQWIVDGYPYTWYEVINRVTDYAPLDYAALKKVFESAQAVNFSTGRVWKI